VCISPPISWRFRHPTTYHLVPLARKFTFQGWPLRSLFPSLVAHPRPPSPLLGLFHLIFATSHHSFARRPRLLQFMLPALQQIHQTEHTRRLQITCHSPSSLVALANSHPKLFRPCLHLPRSFSFTLSSLWLGSLTAAPSFSSINIPPITVLRAPRLTPLS